jgi:hypothetical protein
MALYALLLEFIHSSACHAYQALHNGLQPGESNGFAVIHGIICMHHSSVANSLAPGYSTIYNWTPSMQHQDKKALTSSHIPPILLVTAIGKHNYDTILSLLIFDLLN